MIECLCSRMCRLFFDWKSLAFDNFSRNLINSLPKIIYEEDDWRRYIREVIVKIRYFNKDSFQTVEHIVKYLWTGNGSEKGWYRKHVTELISWCKLDLLIN